MRILRRKSDSEVSSQGFAWFVIGLVLATFLGGAVRTLLSSDQVHSRIVSELKSRFPKHEFKIGKTEVLLSHGLWPGFGLSLSNVFVKQEVCDKLSFTLEVPSIVLPLDLWALKSGIIRLGHVIVRDGKMHLNYLPCVSRSIEEQVPRPPLLKSTGVNWQKTAKQVEAIELENFTLTYQRNVTWKAVLKNLNLEFDGDELAMLGLVEVHKSLPFGSITHLVELDGHGDQNLLQWALRSEFKEGHFAIDGTLDLKSDVAAVKAFGKQLPLKDLVSELFQMGFLDKDLQLKAAWLTCGVQWEGQLTAFKSMPIKVQDCRMEGGYGRVTLEHGEYWADDSEMMFRIPAAFKVERFQMQPLLESLGRKVLPAVLARPGVWSGQILFTSPNAWQLNGFLENTEVVFSNRSVRGKQVLEQVETQFKKTGGFVHGKIENIKIRDGEFKGLIELQLSDDWRNGSFAVDIQKVKLSESIQALLVGESLGDLSIKGTGSLQAGELDRWSGRFTLNSINGIGWRGKNFEVNSRFQLGGFLLEARASEVEVDRSWPQFSQLGVVVRDLSSPVQWMDLSAKIEMNRGGGSISSALGLEQKFHQPWRFKGSWVREGQFLGQLSVSKQGKNQGYAVVGEKGILTLNEN